MDNDINYEYSAGIKHDPGDIYPYSLLFSPLQIRDLNLNNRICWSTPVEAGKIQAVTLPGPEYSAFLQKRAAAGLSLVFVGDCNLYPEEWGALAKDLNQLGCRLAAGLSIPNINKRLSNRRLRKILEYMTESAQRLDKAGVDAIYLDAAAGTFLSWLLARQDEPLSFSYKRSSDYFMQLVYKIRSAIDWGLPLFLRAEPMHLGDNLLHNFKKLGLDGILLQADDSFAGSLKAAKALQSAAIRAENDFFVFAEMPSADSLPSLCELTLMEGLTDGLILSRALLADPDWPSFAYSGRESLLNNCILCTKGCAPSFHLGNIPGCAVNPLTGKESLRSQKGADIFPEKHLAVIGSGPAGLEAALTAWERGFQIALFDINENPFAQFIRFHHSLAQENDELEKKIAEAKDNDKLLFESQDETAIISLHDKNGESFDEGIISASPPADNENDEELASEEINYADMTIGEAKIVAESKEDEEDEDKLVVDKDTLIEFMAQTAAENGNTVADEENLTQPEEESEEDLEEEEIDEALIEEDAPPAIENIWPALNGDFNLDKERRTAWLRYSHYMLSRMRAAEAAGGFKSYFETEVTLAMLAQSRFDIIIIAAGSENGFEVFQMIQDSYVAPLVKIAGAAAGTKGIGEAIRSGYLVASML